MKIRKKKLSQ